MQTDTETETKMRDSNTREVRQRRDTHREVRLSDVSPAMRPLKL